MCDIIPVPVVLIKYDFLTLKCTRNRLAAGFRPDPLGELKCSPRLPSHNKGGLLLSERKGRGKGEEDRVEGNCTKYVKSIRFLFLCS